MNFINMLSWWQWAILALVPPAIFALYFLKLRREPIEVPSTYLWRKSIEDLHVNSLWQRLRRNLLLLLQLLLLLLVILALLRPHWRGASLSGDRFIFLVDNSASMSANDLGSSRLAEAKRQVNSLIEQMGSGDKAMIISFADDAKVMQEFTDNRRELRQRLDAIEPTHRKTSLLMALKMAEGLANPGVATSSEDDEAVNTGLPADLYIFSDGQFPDVEGFSLGNLEPIYIPIGTREADNVAIAQFSVTRDEANQNRLDTFAQLHNYNAEPVTVSVDLYLQQQADGTDRELLDSAEVTIPARDTTELPGVGFVDPPFILENLDSGILALQIDRPDSLMLDNTAYAAVNVPRRGRVLLVTPGNDQLAEALRTQRAQRIAEVTEASPDYLKTKEYQDAAAGGEYDLVIFDRVAPETMPLANTLWVGRVPPSWYRPQGEDPEVNDSEPDPPETATGPQVLDIDRRHPIMEFLNLENLLVVESLVLDPPEGSDVLIDSTAGPICAIAPREGFEDCVLGFEIIAAGDDGRYFNTNWPLRPSFPTWVFNMLLYLGGSRELGTSGSMQPGQVVELSSPSLAAEIEVNRPDGTTQRVRRGRQNTYAYNGTDVTGVYEIYEDDQLAQRFAVNLFSSMESDVAAREDPNIQIGYQQVEGQQDFQVTRREGWKWLILAGVALLMIEWYIYNRRVYL